MTLVQLVHESRLSETYSRGHDTVCHSKTIGQDRACDGREQDWSSHVAVRERLRTKSEEGKGGEREEHMSARGFWAH